MGSVVPLYGDPHDEVQLLLPWYITGQIDATDGEKVEAHLAECESCRREIDFERKLHGYLANLAVDEEVGWSAFRDRIASTKSTRSSRLRLWGTIARQPLWAWAMVAQLALLILAVLVIIRSDDRATYRTLGSPAPSAANVIIIFDPDVKEERFRRTLRMVRAGLVGGPTSSHAYLLRVPPMHRQAALARLRAQPDVIIAEPIDGIADR